jgi:Thioredoxin reductase
VVGSGDAAVEEALFLAKFCDKIYISVIHDKGIMDANKVAQERAWACPKFEFVWNTVVDEYVGDDLLEAVVLRNVKTGEKLSSTWMQYSSLSGMYQTPRFLRASSICRVTATSRPTTS